LKKDQALSAVTKRPAALTGARFASRLRRRSCAIKRHMTFGLVQKRSHRYPFKRDCRRSSANFSASMSLLVSPVLFNGQKRVVRTKNIAANRPRKHFQNSIAMGKKGFVSQKGEPIPTLDLGIESRFPSLKKTIAQVQSSNNELSRRRTLFNQDYAGLEAVCDPGPTEPLGCNKNWNASDRGV
jgi:hypothetical protein